MNAVEEKYPREVHCPQCGGTYPSSETTWFIPAKKDFYCSEKCARLAVKGW